MINYYNDRPRSRHIFQAGEVNAQQQVHQYPPQKPGYFSTKRVAGQVSRLFHF
jgi:hypothetical protein